MLDLQSHVRALTDQHQRNQDAIDQIQRRARAPISLIDYINGRLHIPELNPIKDHGSNSNYEVDQEIRSQSNNTAADGMWVPLSVLAAQRDLTTGGSSALVKTSPRTLVEDLTPASAVIGMGATVLPGIVQGNVPVPRVDTPASASVVSEGNAPADSDPTFSNAVMEPFSVTTTFNISRRMLKSITPATEAVVREIVLRAVMRKVDQLAFAGSGTGEPVGLINSPDVTLIAAGPNGAAPSWALLAEIEEAVDDVTDVRAGAWLTNAKVKRKLRTTARGSGLDFIWPGADLLGKQARTSPHVPSDLSKGTSTGVCSALAYGAWEHLLIGFWGPAAVDLMVDPFTRGRHGDVRLVARLEMGVALDQPSAFAITRDLLTV